MSNCSERKMLFIIPPFFNINDYISNEVKSSLPVLEIPYGVLSISSYVKKHSGFKIDIEIVDLNLEIYKICSENKELDVESLITEIIGKSILRFKPQIVGISALFNTCYSYLELISNTIKQNDKSIISIIGGGLATNLYENILENFPVIDAVSYGEGEIPICELLSANDMNEYLREGLSEAWITRETLKNKVKPKNIVVKNLDEIPFFDYSLINLEMYRGREIDKVNGEIGLKQLPIHTSRGCPFNCIFCASSSVHGKKVRFMSVGKVIEEVEKMIKLYNIKVLAIEDDHFLVDKERAKAILTKLKEFNIRIEFPNATAVYSIDDEISNLLKEAGTTTISLAVESGSDYVLRDIINKPLKTSMVKGAVDSLRKSGINVHANFIIGFPGELEEHRDETIKLIQSVGLDWCYFFIAIPIAGSRLYKLCKENGYLIKESFSDYVTSKCNIKTPEIDPEYIENKAYSMNLQVNFVNNYNVLIGNYNKAASYFENIATKYVEHAFAHYYLALVYEKMNKDLNLISYHKNKFFEIVETNSVWRGYVEKFKLI